MNRPALSNDRMMSSSLNECATADDFQHLFASDMPDLFRLAYLLTADAEKAEHCLILTIRECMASGSVYKWWLPVWTRNVLIRNAIRIVTGGAARPLRKIPHDRMLTAIRRSQQGAIDASDEPAAVFQLSDFDRLVYVIHIIEQYPIRDCVTLLGRSRQEVRDALNRALAYVDAFEQEWRRAPAQLAEDICLLPYNPGAGINDSRRILSA
jgi:hypothetical protein